jgi:hypothetical protein
MVDASHWPSGYKRVATAGGNNLVPTATLLHVIFCPVWSIALHPRRRSYYRRFASLDGRQEACRSQSGPGDVVGPSPCSTVLLARPSRYGLGADGRHVQRAANRCQPISHQHPGLHQLAPSSAYPVSRSPSVLVLSDQEEVSHASAPRPVAPRIRTITVQRSLSPPSSTRVAIAAPCDAPTIAGAIRAYRVPHV